MGLLSTVGQARVPSRGRGMIIGEMLRARQTVLRTTITAAFVPVVPARKASGRVGSACAQVAVCFRARLTDRWAWQFGLGTGEYSSPATTATESN